MAGETSERDQKLLAQRLLIAVVAPVGLLLLVGLILAFQVVKLQDTAHWVDHTDEVIGRISEIQTQIVDQETGIRGFLLTGDRAFLAPYERAQPLPMFAAVHGLVADNPPQQVRADAARARYEAWLKMNEPLLELGAELNRYRLQEELLERKRRMDSIREALQNMLLVEQGLRVDHQQISAVRERDQELPSARCIEGQITARMNAVWRRSRSVDPWHVGDRGRVAAIRLLREDVGHRPGGTGQ